MRLTILVLVVFVSTCFASPRFMRREGKPGPKPPKDGDKELNTDELKNQLGACKEILNAVPDCSQNAVERVLTRAIQSVQNDECGKLLTQVESFLNKHGDEPTGRPKGEKPEEEKPEEEESEEEESEEKPEEEKPEGEEPEEVTQEPQQETDQVVRKLLKLLREYTRK